jgi:uncharacterized protein YndB with AHSA1/START domain
MNKPFFVYTIYIASTPEKVFKALTDTDVTAKFWFGNAVKLTGSPGARSNSVARGSLSSKAKC